MSSRRDAGLMSLMQFWTKFYADLGRPLPKVDVCFTFSSFLLNAQGWFVVGFLGGFYLQLHVCKKCNCPCSSLT